MVSTEKIANDLLRERGNLYSSREQLPMAAKLMGRNLRPLFLPYGGEKTQYNFLGRELASGSASDPDVD